MTYYDRKFGERWHLEWGFFNYHENTLVALELGPIKSSGSSGVWYNFFFGVSLFYFSLFYFDLGYNKTSNLNV